MSNTEPTTGTWRNVNRLAGGRLAEIIRQARDEGDSWRRLSSRLAADYGIEVSDQTLINWATTLGIDTRKTAA